jgi:hypothetical protein
MFCIRKSDTIIEAERGIIFEACLSMDSRGSPYVIMKIALADADDVMPRGFR